MAYMFLPYTIDGLSVAYFRGKKLHGKRLHLPKGSRGVVVSKTDRKIVSGRAEKISTPIPEEEIDIDKGEIQEDEQPDVTILEEIYEFENIMIWGHESQPDPITDPHMRGILEWIDFSTLVRISTNTNPSFITSLVYEFKSPDLTPWELTQFLNTGVIFYISTP
ncbi:hypothetical protein Golomagni_05910 [Golovinomyces magnicellulatus]|nr:hypothetical protein Golomagni_05910 [Golovinomyces magnicellulatus]